MSSVVQVAKRAAYVQRRREEPSSGYNFGGYCPLSPKDILKDRYVCISKTGYGIFSTVWLVYDLQEERHCALKVVRASPSFSQAALDEIQLSKHINQLAAETNHPGKRSLVTYRDHFRHYSPNGQHVVLVQEIEGECLRSFLDRHEPLSLPIVKHVARELLLALDFLHESNLTHTDIKSNNLLIGLPDAEAAIRSDPVLALASAEAIEHARALRRPPPPSTRKPHAVPINAAIRRERSRDRNSLYARPHEISRSIPITSPPVTYRVRFDQQPAAPADAVQSPSTDASDSPSTSFESATSSMSPSPWMSTGSTSSTVLSDQLLTPADLSPDALCSSLSALGILAEEQIVPCEDCASVKTAAPAAGDGKVAELSRLELPSTSARRNSLTRPKTSHGVVEWEGQPFSVKIADLGNATRSDAHHVYDIQTLEYRAPEVVLGRSWDDKVDVWSMGCVFFELATGDVLFNPCEAGPCPSFSKEEDLLAQMQELTEYDLQPDDLEGGAYASRFFAPNGRMRRIKSLNYWPLYEVLKDKYLFDHVDALRFSRFLSRLLTMPPDQRPSAKELLDDPFLTGAPIDEGPFVSRRANRPSGASNASIHSATTPDLVSSFLSDRSQPSSPELCLVNARASFKRNLAELSSAGPWSKP